MAHGVGDWLLQKSLWAKQKTCNIKYLLIHSFVYSFFITLGFVFATKGFNNSFFIFIFMFITHALIDTRKPVLFWVNKIKGDYKAPQWLVFIIDQWFHIILLYIIFKIWM
ncbi:MAG: DUF3307 domain-containing protein [archaeon]